MQAKVTSQRKGGGNLVSNMKPQMGRKILPMENFSKTETFGAEEVLRPGLLSLSWKTSWENGNQI
jgi:hypothetical protein